MNARSTDGSDDRAAIYRKAARTLEKAKSPHGFGCCGAVCRTLVLDSHSMDACRPFHRDLAEFFCPSEYQTGGYYMGQLTEENRGPRIIALCFMASMIEAGDA